jgi:zinc transport system permease protein
MTDFLMRALAAGVLLALVCGPLGCFIVWRRMAYFGDTLAHSALLGIALGILLEINLQLSVVVLCCMLALLLVIMEKGGKLATDTILGILAHSALALGLVALSFTDTRIDLLAFLFGDLLAVSNTELLWMLFGGSLALLILLKFWNRLLAMTLNQEMAQVEGTQVLQLRLLLMLVMAIVVAGAMKIVGILLITSLLIIPPAAARHLATSPEQMAIVASLVGTLAVIGGIGVSWFWDTPTGPSIVVVAAVIFAALSCLKARQAC